MKNDILNNPVTHGSALMNIFILLPINAILKKIKFVLNSMKTELL
jgi:hypothetical protein